jgi:hypothetical protein
VAAAATEAACQALFQGVTRTGALELDTPAAAAAAAGVVAGAAGAGGGPSSGTTGGSGVLRYITIARESGWGAGGE